MQSYNSRVFLAFSLMCRAWSCTKSHYGCALLSTDGKLFPLPHRLCQGLCLHQASDCGSLQRPLLMTRIDWLCALHLLTIIVYNRQIWKQRVWRQEFCTSDICIYLSVYKMFTICSPSETAKLIHSSQPPAGKQNTKNSSVAQDTHGNSISLLIYRFNIPIHGWVSACGTSTELLTWGKQVCQKGGQLVSWWTYAASAVEASCRSKLSKQAVEAKWKRLKERDRLMNVDDMILYSWWEEIRK